MVEEYNPEFEVLRGELLPGETLLWSGRSRGLSTGQTLALMAIFVPLILICMAPTWFQVWMIIRAVQAAEDIYLQLLFLLPLAAIPVFVVVYFLHRSRKMRHTLYGVTDRRILLWQPAGLTLSGGSLQSFMPNTFTQLRVIEHNAGYGTVHFAREMTQRRRGQPFKQNVSFVNVAGAHQVRDLIASQFAARLGSVRHG